MVSVITYRDNVLEGIKRRSSNLKVPIMDNGYQDQAFKINDTYTNYIKNINFLN